MYAIGHYYGKIAIQLGSANLSNCAQVGLGGPTVTNVDVTSHWQFYGGGVFYSEGQCDSYEWEQVNIAD